jgi:hypothetical protein
MAGAVAGIACLLVCRTAAIAGAPPNAPPGTPFPNFDIAKSCQRVPNVEGCLAQEEQAKQQLGALWRQMSEAKKGACSALGASVPGGSYLTALSCARRP